MGDDSYSSEAYLNVPTQLHTDPNQLLGRFSSTSPSQSDFDSTSPEPNSHPTRNPLVKALSNSNLNSVLDLGSLAGQEHNQIHKFVHSEVDLLGLNDEVQHPQLHQHHLLLHTTAAAPSHLGVPPRRPPPPSFHNLAALAHKEDKLIDIQSDASNDDPVVVETESGQIPRKPSLPLVEATNETSNVETAAVTFGFDDDFSKLTTNELAFEQPSRPPPPLPPPSATHPPVNSNSNNPPPLPPPPIVPHRPVPPLPPPPTSNLSRMCFNLSCCLWDFILCACMSANEFV